MDIHRCVAMKRTLVHRRSRARSCPLAIRAAVANMRNDCNPQTIRTHKRTFQRAKNTEFCKHCLVRFGNRCVDFIYMPIVSLGWVGARVRKQKMRTEHICARGLRCHQVFHKCWSALALQRSGNSAITTLRYCTNSLGSFPSWMREACWYPAQSGVARVSRHSFRLPCEPAGLSPVVDITTCTLCIDSNSNESWELEHKTLAARSAT